MYAKNRYLVPGITTARLALRLLDVKDLDACLPFFEHPQSYRFWSTEGKAPLGLRAEWFERQQQRYETGKGGALAVVDKGSGRLYGWCGLLVQEVDGKQELEVGYSMLPEYWGKGYATEASPACLLTAFEKNLADSVISIIHVDNTPSRKVAGKNGMVIDGQTIYHGNPVFIYRRWRGT